MDLKSLRVRGIRSKAKQWIPRMAAGLGLLALAFVCGSLGHSSRALNGLLAIGALLSLALLWARSPGSIPPSRLALALVLMAVSLPLVARGEPLGLLGVTIFLFALSLLPLRDGGTATALLLTSLLFTLYRSLVAYIPALWHGERWLALRFSWIAGWGLRLGPTALGLPLVFLFAFYAVSVLLLSISRPGSDSASPIEPTVGRLRGSLILLLWLVALILAVVAYIWLQPALGSWLLTNWPEFPFISSPRPSPPAPWTLTYLDTPLLLFALLWLASAPAVLALRPNALPLTAPRRSSRWVTAGLSLLALGGLVLSLDPPSHPQRGTILFYDTGHLEWGRPLFGRYGARSGGTYGLWPDYLSLYGYQARIGPLTTENLDGASAVVLISLPENFGDAEKERLLAFVQDGGGLIIWGEHTGVGRIREPINDLLAALPGAPMHLRFDSAVPSRQGWAEGLALLPHPAVYDVQDPIDLVIAVGASLDIRPPANPIIIGRFGHSDDGDYTNLARNFVGDMLYNPGEPLGDVVLAAQVDHGQGRIVVMGDTTPLGSVNLMTTMPFQVRLLDWVTARDPGAWHLLLRNGWLAALLLAGAAILLARGRSRLTLAGAAVVLGLTLLLTARWNSARSAPPLPSGPIAYVDVSHQERVDRLLWEETSIGGLDYNLVRNGALPLLQRELDASALEGAQLLVVIAPAEPFSRREVRAISKWVKGGGRLLVSVGWEESEASQCLLAAFGLQVGHVPLGPVEVEHDMALPQVVSTVRFHEAWPVSAELADAQTIVEGYDYPLALYQPWGQGAVVLLGDSAFLLGETLEGQDRYNEGNILFLRDIMQEYLGFTGPARPSAESGS
jgi:hypothetical protein